MAQQAELINGINVPKLLETINAVKNDPSKGMTSWRAKVKWAGGTRSDVYIRDFPPIRMDEPPALTGTNTAP